MGEVGTSASVLGSGSCPAAQAEDLFYLTTGSTWLSDELVLYIFRFLRPNELARPLDQWRLWYQRFTCQQRQRKPTAAKGTTLLNSARRSWYEMSWVYADMQLHWAARIGRRGPGANKLVICWTSRIRRATLVTSASSGSQAVPCTLTVSQCLVLLNLAFASCHRNTSRSKVRSRRRRSSRRRVGMRRRRQIFHRISSCRTDRYVDDDECDLHRCALTYLHHAFERYRILAGLRNGTNILGGIKLRVSERHRLWRHGEAIRRLGRSVRRDQHADGFRSARRHCFLPRQSAIGDLAQAADGSQIRMHMSVDVDSSRHRYGHEERANDHLGYPRPPSVICIRRAFICATCTWTPRTTTATAVLSLGRECSP